MIAVRLTEIGGQALDVTRKMMVERGITVTQELERRAFERTVDDVRLTLNNISGEFSSFFANIRPTTRYMLEVYSITRRIFRGFVDNPSVDFSRTQKTITLDAFSTTKLMWDRAKTTQIMPLTNYRTDQIYLTLDEVFQQQRLQTNFNDTRGIFSTFNLGRYASRLVRWAAVASAPTGNEGRFVDLDPTTTWDDLLKACAMQYNAEFFVDPETSELTMLSRGKPISSSVRSLDSILVSSKDIGATYIDDQKVDWLYVHSGLSQPTPVVTGFHTTTTGAGLPQPGLKPGVYVYIITGIIDDAETGISATASVTLPQLPLIQNQEQRQAVELVIPASPISGTTGRRLYRFSSDGGQLGYRLVNSFAGNTETAFTDIYETAILVNAAQPSSYARTFNQWVKFDEVSGGWGGFIIDAQNGKNRPAGDIFDAAPKLTFISGNSEVRDDPYWVYSFFARERNFTDPNVQKDWEDMFRMRRRLDCRAKGVDFRVGDRFTVSQQIVPNDLTSTDELVVKKAMIQGIEEETDLQLLTI